MNIDTRKRQVVLTRTELKNHQNYLKVKDFVYERGYELVVSEPPAMRPYRALSLSREEARNTQIYEAAKARAEREGRPFWLE
jgi:hypothetical protein